MLSHFNCASTLKDCHHHLRELCLHILATDYSVDSSFLSLFLSIHFVLLVFLFPVVGPNQTIQKYVVILETNQTMLSLIMTENSFHRGSAVCGLRCEVQLFVICVKGPYNSPLTTVLECTKWFQMVHRVAVNSEFICIK